jgi:release factor glutamine methyltransferase
MSAIPPSAEYAAAVSELRAAGCVFAEDEARLLVEAADSPAQLAVLVSRRAGGIPLEHLLGWAEFCGLRIVVGPGVFVPRRRSELLVREALALAGERAVVVDLCCGSGAIGAALRAAQDGIELHAADIEAAAVEVARRNLEPGGHVYEGDLYEPLPESLRGRVDILVVNAPYVPTEAIALMPPEARDHEPAVALDGGVDGLAVLGRIVAGASGWLAPGGDLLFETSSAQVSAAVDLVTRSGLVARVVTCEDLGATVVVAGLGAQ